MLRVILIMVCLMGPGVVGAWAADEPPADNWVTNQVVFPRNIAASWVQGLGFEDLRGEAISARQFKVVWRPARLDTNAVVTLVASADELGHWPVRDWRSYPMMLAEGAWSARPPIDDIHVPLVYFVR